MNQMYVQVTESDDASVAATFSVTESPVTFVWPVIASTLTRGDTAQLNVSVLVSVP